MVGLKQTKLELTSKRKTNSKRKKKKKCSKTFDNQEQAHTTAFSFQVKIPDLIQNYSSRLQLKLSNETT